MGPTDRGGAGRASPEAHSPSSVAMRLHHSIFRQQDPCPFLDSQDSFFITHFSTVFIPISSYSLAISLFRHVS